MSEPCFFCPLCPYASKRNNDLKKHHETHHNPERTVVRRIRRRKCDKCEEILDGKKAFKLHMREKHPPEKIFKKRIFKKPCEQCEEVLEGMKAFKEHMKEKHAILPADIRCETCHRRFKTNHRLKKHNLKFGEHFPAISLIPPLIFTSISSRIRCRLPNILPTKWSRHDL
jgi:hypothetical protein